MIDDPLGQYLDILGVNEYIGWSDGVAKKADSLSWKTTYDKPVVISEFGVPVSR
jgi:beta-glucuronidase